MKRRQTLRITAPDGSGFDHEWTVTVRGIEHRPITRTGTPRGPIRRAQTWSEFTTSLRDAIYDDLRDILGGPAPTHDTGENR